MMPFYNPADLASNLQNLQHLQHLQQQQQQQQQNISTTNYWNGVKNVTGREDSAVAWKQFEAGETQKSEQANDKRKRSESDDDDDRRPSPTSFTHGMQIHHFLNGFIENLICVLEKSLHYYPLSNL